MFVVCKDVAIPFDKFLPFGQQIQRLLPIQAALAALSHGHMYICRRCTGSGARWARITLIIGDICVVNLHKNAARLSGDLKESLL